jgi:ferric-dicitrate binding protein FerR (iron transport regulator)
MSEEKTYIISGLSESDSDALFARYMSGECSSEDLLLLEQWSTADSSHAAYLKQLQTLWNEAPQAAAPVEFDENAAWKRMQARMHVHEQTYDAAHTAPVVRSLWQRFTPARIAASVALVIGIAATLYFVSKDDVQAQQRSLAATDKPVESRLSDGSNVHLNCDTRLDYPENFTGKQREVTLSGEAFFNVQRDTKKPFIIHAGPVDVRVLGTSFNVKAYPGREEVLVSVESGKVRCAAGNDSIELIAGEEGIYNIRTKLLRRNVMDNPNAFAFRTRKLAFRNTPLKKVADDLSDFYNITIIIKNPNLQNCSVNTGFGSETLDQALDKLRFGYDSLVIEKQGNIVYLDGKPWN